MGTLFDTLDDAPPAPRPAAVGPRVWSVSALAHAIADALDARFTPVAVRGEVSGLRRAPSGHVYFSLKDERAQLQCVMYRSAALRLGALPGEGAQVRADGRLALYAPLPT